MSIPKEGSAGDLGEAFGINELLFEFTRKGDPWPTMAQFHSHALEHTGAPFELPSLSVGEKNQLYIMLGI